MLIFRSIIQGVNYCMFNGLRIFAGYYKNFIYKNENIIQLAKTIFKD